MFGRSLKVTIFNGTLIALSSAGRFTVELPSQVMFR